MTPLTSSSFEPNEYSMSIKPNPNQASTRTAPIAYNARFTRAELKEDAMKTLENIKKACNPDADDLQFIGLVKRSGKSEGKDLFSIAIPTYMYDEKIKDIASDAGISRGRSVADADLTQPTKEKAGPAAPPAPPRINP